MGRMVMGFAIHSPEHDSGSARLDSAVPACNSASVWPAFLDFFRAPPFRI